MTIFVSNIRREAGRILFYLRTSTNNSIKLSIMRHQSTSFLPKRVLIVTKVSRFKFERLREPDIDESLFKLRLLQRGSNYDSMLANHEKNKIVERKLVDTLEKNQIEYKITNRFTIEQAHFDWAELIIAVGGDGTFLLGANLIIDNKKPIFGINSDPDSSEGYLMLDRRYTNDIPKIFKLLNAGDYEFVMRTRIRVTIQGEKNQIWQPTFHMHEKNHIVGQSNCQVNSNQVLDSDSQVSDQRKLPWLALNEVFIGEALSAKTSLLEIRIDDEENYHKFKSSGICVSTGTGSSAWYKAINSLTPQTVKEILNVASPTNKYTDKEIDKISSDYNNSLQFLSDDVRMSYAIRDIILNDIWPLPKTIKPRAFCNRLTIRSQCYDAGLVLDGGIGVPFNIGSIAILETHPDDALRTIKLPN
ncbi:NAD kinase 2, mitochondrial [Microplitis mediator]|uniref:NAD kinase 2, mitochondrial n=1 Tax=Microplitis mediator TaxID=375433 RepID=UPI002552A2CE|nr:NAD kinase 2, mitochondrial [Microplitis mediator]